MLQVPPNLTNPEQVTNSETRCLVNLMELGERVQKRLAKITNGSPFEFVHCICKQLLQDHDKDRVHTFSIELSKLQKMLYKYQNEVLQLDGVGNNYKKLQNIVKDVRLVLEWVDELLVLAMVDIHEVRQLYYTSELLYQKK